MVLQNIVDYYLNKILKDYIEDYSSDQFNLKFGIAELKNLRIKLNAINSLDLPVKLKHGFIENLTIKVNFKNIYSTQLSLSINDVNLVFVPSSSSKYDEELELEKQRIFKNIQLERIEQTLQSMSTDGTQTFENKDDSLVTKILLQIFNNVQIRIENVHIRLEDDLSNVKTPFAFGLTFSNLVFVTPDLKEKQKFTLVNSSSGIFKIAILSHFGLYFNCYQKDSYHDYFLSVFHDYRLINEIMKKQIASEFQKPQDIDYVLEPINFHCKVFIHRKPYEDNFEIPSVDLEMVLDKFALDLGQEQFETLIVVADNVNRLNIGTAYKKWRPEICIQGNGKIWWNFAITCILETQVRRRRNNWNWNFMRSHLQKRKKYKELYKKKLLNERIRENLENLLQKYEDEFDVLNITIVRNQARLECKEQLELLQRQKERQIEEQKNNTGWFSGWWSRGSKTAGSLDNDAKNIQKNKMNLIEEVKKEFSEESEKEKLYAAINYDETQIDQTYPLGYISQKISFVIKSINLNITDKEKKVQISEFFLSEVKLFLSILPTSNGIDLRLSVNSMKMFGLHNKLIPIIEPIQSTKMAFNMIEIEFVMNPFEKTKYDFDVKIQAQGLKIIYDNKTINRMSEMFTVTRDVNLDEIQTLASLKLNEFQQRSLLGLEYAIENHKKLNLSVNIEPSFILIPETGSIDSADHILLISLGHFNVVSKLVDYDKKELQDMVTNKSIEEKLEIVRNSAYENYLLSISKIQLILSDKKNWEKDINSTHNSSNQSFDEKITERHLLYPLSLDVIFLRSIIIDDPDLALLKLKVKIPDIQLIVEHKQIIDLVKLFLSIIKVNKLNSSNDRQTEITNVKEHSKLLSRVKRNNQDDVVKVITNEKIIINKKTVKQEKVLDQIKVLAELSIQKFLIELKTQSNTIVRGLMNELSSNLKMTNKKNDIEFNLESIQFFCCMNYYSFINRIQIEIIEQLNKEESDTIKELQNTYGNYNQETKNDEKIFKKNRQDIKKSQQGIQRTKACLHVGRVDFIMLEDFKLKHNAVVIFNMQLLATYDQIKDEMIVNLQLINTQMAITELRSYLENSYVELFILKPCELLCNVIMNGEYQKIVVEMQTLSLSISPNMVQILMNMIGKLGSSPKLKEDDQENDKLITKATEFRKNRELDENLWYIKLMEHELSEIDTAFEAIEDSDLASPCSEVSGREEEEIKQTFFFTIKTINFIIESGGVSSIPLVKFNTNLSIKFVNYASLNLKMQMFMEYYNEKNFNWEPVLDCIDDQQWEFETKLEFIDKKRIKNQKQTLISFESKRRLEITVSNVALGIFKSLASSFTKAVNQPEVLSKEEQKIVIRNSTEMFLFFHIENSKLKCHLTGIKSSSTDIKSINSSVDIISLKPFSELTILPLSKDSFDNILNYSFIVNGDEINRSLPLMSTDKSINVIYSNTYPGITWKYVIDCSLRDKQTRFIDFCSNVIVHNHLQIPVGIYKYNEDSETPEKVGYVNPDEIFYLPINLVYNYENQYVYIRPSDNYLLPVNALIWRFDDINQIKKNRKLYKTILCEPIDKNRDHDIYIRLLHKIESIRIENCNENEEENFDVLHHFELYPQFLIRNLLPVELIYRANFKQIESKKLESGQSNQVIYVRTKNSEIYFDLPNYNDQSWRCMKTNFEWPKEDLTEVFEFKSKNEETLLIAANFINSDENGFRLLTIFAPFWMVNSTGLRLFYSFGDNQIVHEPNSQEINLVCYKSKQLTQKKKMQLRLEDSNWSERFPVDVVGNKGSIMVEMNDGTLCFFTIDISLSELLFTKIVKFTAFYTIVSRINFDLDISEDGTNWKRLECKTSQAMFPRDNKAAKIHFKMPNEDLFSKGVSLKCTAMTVFDVNNVMICCCVEVTNHAVVIEIINYYYGSAPALIVNCLDITLDYGQLGVENRNRLPPKSMVLFNWTEPLGFRVLNWSTVDSNEIQNALDKDAFGQSDVGEIFWISFIDENQRILLVTKNKKFVNKIFTAGDVLEPDTKMIVNLNGLGVSIVDLNITRELCYFSISSSDVIWELKKVGSKIFKPFVGKQIDIIEDAYQKFLLHKKSCNQLSEESTIDNSLQKIGEIFVINFETMKMISPNIGKLRRNYSNGFYLNISQSSKSINLHLKMNKIQLDNQLDDHIFATIFCPVPPPKSIKNDYMPKPFVEFSTIIQFENNRRRFKYFSFLIQEFAIQLDLDFLTALQSYLEVITKKISTNYEELVKNSIEFAIRPKINLETSSTSKHHYDLIHLSPLKMHLSFSLGTIDTLNLPGILDYLVKSAGVTLIEFKDAVLRINSFMRENTMLTDDEFILELTDHYKAAALSQLYIIIFGLDVIGNPVGLFLGVTRGVNDLFYEPAMGLVQGPEEFAEGLVLGVRSLFSSTVGGVAGAVSRITGTLGEGISSLMKQSERKKRRERLNKNTGILQNSKNLARGFFTGVTGLVKNPMEGVKKEGFEGLIKGVGQGMIGLVAQPTTGIIDFTSGALSQLQRSVNVSEEVKRIRLARAIHLDGILTSYNSHDAAGREILKNLGNKSTFLHNDIYFNHILVGENRYFIITNKHILYVKNVCLFKSFDVDWYLENSNINQIEIKSNVLCIYLKKPKKAFGLFGEKYVFELICESSDIVMKIHDELKSFIKTDWEF